MAEGGQRCKCSEWGAKLCRGGVRCSANNLAIVPTPMQSWKSCLRPQQICNHVRLPSSAADMRLWKSCLQPQQICNRGRVAFIHSRYAILEELPSTTAGWVRGKNSPDPQNPRLCIHGDRHSKLDPQSHSSLQVLQFGLTMGPIDNTGCIGPCCRPL